VRAFEYANTNTVLLGLVVEKVSGQQLADYIGEHILAPLDMNHTIFPTTNAFPEPHAQGYTDQTLGGAESMATDNSDGESPILSPPDLYPWFRSRVVRVEGRVIIRNLNGVVKRLEIGAGALSSRFGCRVTAPIGRRFGGVPAR
jgi:CubicO group peptidase (beta-lactamase class C family)